MTNVTFDTFPDTTFKLCSVNQVLSSQNSLLIHPQENGNESSL